MLIWDKSAGGFVDKPSDAKVCAHRNCCILKSDCRMSGGQCTDYEPEQEVSHAG